MTDTHAARPDHDPTRARVALLAGATGLIGHALLAQLLACARYARVHALLRRPAPGLADNPKLALQIVDFAALEHRLPPVDDVYIALGTTIKVAGSEAAFRRIDFDAVVNTAQAARAAGATRLAVVSALGADAHSRIFYNRVKGEMQQAVQALGYASVVFAQPSLLIGDRLTLGQPERRAERWAERLLAPVMGLVPRGVRPITVDKVARALLQATLDARPSVRFLSSGDMQAATGVRADATGHTRAR